jgi:FHS family L-fucose permease-like MFS transporter
MTSTGTEPHTPATPAQPANYRGPLAVVALLFFIFGFLTCLNDILVPHLKSIFELNYAQVMLIQFSFFSAYFVFSIPASKIINWIGYQGTMVAALLTMGAGAFLFVPAAAAPSYPLFLTALIILAAGITALQVAVNPYTIVLGPPETASSRLNLTQAFNSLGTTIAPKVGGLLILSTMPLAIAEMQKLSPAALHAYRAQQAASVKTPYIVIGVLLVLLAVVIGRSKLPKFKSAQRQPGQPVNDSLWKHPNLILGALGIFTYVGAEVSIGSFLINYLTQPGIAGLTEKGASGYVSFYWGGAMIGRFIGSALLRKIKTGHLLALCAICTTALVTTSMLSSGRPAMWSILAVGFFNSIMFPSIFTLGLAELGPLSGSGSGILNMAIVGGAVVPLAQGFIADRIGIHHAFFMPVICYLYILYYALAGSRPNSRRLRPALRRTSVVGAQRQPV